MTSGPSTHATAPEPAASVRARPIGRRRSAATSAPSRQASTATSEPTTIENICAARNQLAAPANQIGIAARNVGSGSQTSKPGRGRTSGGVP